MSTTGSSRKFHFIREIASGGFGSVYLAKVIHTDGFSRLAAIKLLHPKWSENEEIASRMRDEARLLGWLRHKNIVDVMDLTMIDGRCAVIMEYLEAVDVKEVLVWCRAEGQQVPLRVALQVCAGVASALDAAYNRPPYAGEKPLRVIHRDIKPSNVMVDESGVVKVLDFGVARAEFDEREAKTQELSFGSLEYMPPERLFFEPETPASDVYSLGATLFEMVGLAKFGKAKLRGPDQERFFEDRFEALLDRHPLPSEEIEDIFHDLLYDMLAFDEAERPTAADCVTRMRSFARRLTSMESVEEWAERLIPPLVKRQQGSKPRENPLVDRVLTEDTAGFASADPKEPGPSGAPQAAPESFDEYEEEDVVTTGKQDDARWDEIKRSTLRSLSDQGKIPAPPPVPKGLRTALVNAPSPIAPPSPPSPTPGSELEAEEEEDATVYFARGQEAVKALHEGALMDLEDAASSTVHFSRDQAMGALFETPQPVDGLDDPYGFELDEDEEEDDEDEEDTAAQGYHLGEEETTGAAVSAEAALASSGARASKNEARSQKGAPGAKKRGDVPKPEAPPSGGGWLRWVAMAALFLLISGAVAGGVVMVLGAGGAVLVFGGAASTLPAQVPSAVADGEAEPAEPEPDPAEPDAAEEPEEPDAGADEEAEDAPEEAPPDGAHFVSLWEGTKKIVVRCDAHKADGVSEATISEPDLGDCIVTAVGASRKRQTAVVERVEHRRYRCFEGDSKTCE